MENTLNSGSEYLSHGRRGNKIASSESKMRNRALFSECISQDHSKRRLTSNSLKSLSIVKLLSGGNLSEAPCNI